MKHAMYDELVDWYRLIDPVEDHEPECERFIELLQDAVDGPAETLLELGAGAGHNAHFMRRAFSCTLTDLSAQMLALSEELNPDAEHVHADMRELRLHRTFDAILAHDAIVYMTTEEDLTRAVQTAWEHLRPGGAALFVPDCVAESFVEYTDLYVAQDKETGRAMRCTAWMWRDSPTSKTYNVDYAYLLREGSTSRAVHDQHVEGLFSVATWERILSSVGFEVIRHPRPLDAEEARIYFNELFICKRPA